jgi:hypothetical protein
MEREGPGECELHSHVARKSFDLRSRGKSNCFREAPHGFCTV